ncbi:Protein CHUP1, chloroplastic, partial [Mucuna pruriens]
MGKLEYGQRAKTATSNESEGGKSQTNSSCLPFFISHINYHSNRNSIGLTLKRGRNKNHWRNMLGLIVAASIAALTVKQLNVNNPRSEHGEARFRKHQDEGAELEQVACSTTGHTEKREEEEQEEVKLINSIINRTDDFEDDILPEFERLLSGEIDFPSLAEAKKDRVDETEMANNASELERLRNLVKELEEREVKLESELLEYYGLKEQQSDFVELQRQLRIKTVEVDMLNMTINSLQEERKKLQEELGDGASAKRELEVARSKIKELQRQIQLEASQAKTQLLMLKQKVSGLVAKEEEAVKKDAEIGKKLKALNDLEVEVVELKRKNKELQHEKRELTVKLNAAESRITELSKVTENEMVAKAKEEVSSLRHVNEDLLKQVEGLQVNRFSEVEELVYLRWVNACLRYELKNYQAPPGKLSARDLNTSLSPKSQEKAKQLMLEYAGSEHGQGDTDLDSNFSHSSSPGSEDFDNASSIDSSTSKYSSLSKKTSLIQKLKKWGKSKDDSSALSSPARYLSGGSPSRMSTSNRPRDSLESLMQRNAGDTVAITTFEQKDREPTDSSETLALPNIRVSSNDSLNSVAASFQLMSKTIIGSLDEKYPAYKDRHKLALAREKQIKEKAEKARVQKFGDNSVLNMTKAERERTICLPPKLTQLKEKKYVSGCPNDHPDNAKNVDNHTISKMKHAHIEKRLPRVPQPPPKPSDDAPVSTNPNPSNGESCAPSVPPPPPPPAPPPPPMGSLSRGALAGDKVYRAPELVEFYQTLMKREAKKETSSLTSLTTSASDARSNMIGEIENRSSFLLAVKADVETQGDFVMSLAAEVRAASFSKIEDLVAFVNWLDEELSFLVDERAVLKHFDWPEGKVDALREAAFEYLDLMKLEKQVSTFSDDPNLPCEAALQKMYSLLEKVEQSVYALLRTRDMAISRYKEFGIPVSWLLDTGVVGKIKLSSVQLANKYMKRVASELDILSEPEKEPTREFLILQGVRFAFRVHQFAGGFDAESMKAFEDLRSRIHAPAGEDNNQKHR